MTEQHDSLILQFLARVFIVPFLLVFSMYIFVHGEVSPGGGFQAGAIAAAGIIVGKLTLGMEYSERRVSTRWLLALACAGTILYVLAGLVPMFFGVNFLDYSELPVEWFNAIADHERTNRAMGIFIIEFGVFAAVTGVLVLLYNYLTRRFRDD
ncbi:MAG: MnhB domain-containing protein [Dehalococcoidia bacterium]